MVFGLVECLYECITDFFRKRRARKASEFCKAALRAEGRSVLSAFGTRLVLEPSFKEELKQVVAGVISNLEKERDEVHQKAHEYMAGFHAPIQYKPKRRRRKK